MPTLEEMGQLTDRLHSAIAAVAPIEGISVGRLGDPATVKIQFQKAATDEQRAAAASALKEFDWTPETSEARAKREAIASVASETAQKKADDAEKQALLDGLNECRALLSLKPIELAELKAMATAELGK